MTLSLFSLLESRVDPAAHESAHREDLEQSFRIKERTIPPLRNVLLKRKIHPNNTTISNPDEDVRDLQHRTTGGRVRARSPYAEPDYISSHGKGEQLTEKNVTKGMRIR
ncbi:hypothetical protein BDBG_04947 [Blastomyces gilchristii SLH14081]|uniref:Uncharacterized protein n=1 Tax=Blastomyces gilchristii (strain SLH14081) TaxID=559298 RepID=A0A179ULE6_BLAGS|nr:uncharacterized protein BDBG_04947 [Blastomyces gilchristii SLH14081]EQL28626.1 hypothetical protein BDFG_08681 [Blastomyces dermatitidis ATCC 26199]OAT08710.1 hypothetical protein BDBG_04947 [Blastomyces gilchristii SLH14081]